MWLKLYEQAIWMKFCTVIDNLRCQNRLSCPLVITHCVSQETSVPITIWKYFLLTKPVQSKWLDIGFMNAKIELIQPLWPHAQLIAHTEQTKEFYLNVPKNRNRLFCAQKIATQSKIMLLSVTRLWEETFCWTRFIIQLNSV